MGKSKRIFAYTDGSTQSNPGIGGYATVFVSSNKKNIIHKHAEFIDIATNNQAELLATIFSIEYFLENFNKRRYLVVVTDSKYCTLGFNSRMENWCKREWKTVAGKNVSNIMLWKKLHKLKEEHQSRIFFQWVKGHNGDKFNELADQLSRKIWRKKLKELTNE